MSDLEDDDVKNSCKESLPEKKQLKVFGISTPFKVKKNHPIAHVRLFGTIASDVRADRINLQISGPVLKRAFAHKKTKTVAISINSPGGSPVQAGQVAKLITNLKKQHDKQVLIFIEDVAASGGYMIAVAGDEIIADPSSIVGSIGVISAGFGFEGAIDKIGVTRRVYVAGKNKSVLDPFAPPKKADIDHLKKLQNDIHDLFINHVKTHRGDKLDKTNKDLFTGLFWTGKMGLELGLVDTLGDLDTEIRMRFGDAAKLVPFAPKRSPFALRLPFLGGQVREDRLVAAALESIEQRGLWNRFGL